MHVSRAELAGKARGKRRITTIKEIKNSKNKTCINSSKAQLMQRNKTGLSFGKCL